MNGSEPAGATRLDHAEPLRRLRAFIESGGYAPGDRLPPERALIHALGVSRGALRKGLDALEREGAIWRHVGKGTFVAANAGDGTLSGLAELSHRVTPVQMMRARLALEPSIAREAAVNASAEAVLRLRAARDRARAAESWDAYESDDDAFHRCVAEASGNILLRSLFDHLNQVRRAVAWRQVIRRTERPPDDHPSFAEHDALLDAIAARDPEAAQGAMRAHLRSVAARLFGEH